MFKKIILISVLYLMSNTVSLAASKKTYLSFIYRVKRTNTIELILKDFSLKTKNSKNFTRALRKTIKSNPNLNPKKVTQGQKVKLYIVKENFDKKEYDNYVKQTKRKLKEIEDSKKEVVKESNYSKSELKFSAFYMMTTGGFEQLKPQGINFDYKQNSLLSLGVTAAYFPRKSNFSYSLNTYFSKIGDVSSSLPNQPEVEVPNEYVFSSYAHYQFDKRNLSIFTGFDYDTFSTFNQGALTNNNVATLDNNTAGYLTIGVTKVFKISNFKLFTNWSFSKSIFTSREIEAGGIEPDQKYSGFKTKLYLSHKLSKKTYVHSLMMYHKMNGPDDLVITRIGLGLGYLFF
jgi:hypothetical protein